MATIMSLASTSYPYGLNQVGYSTLVLSCFFSAICTVTVILRLATRVVAKVALGIDDILIILALFFFYAFCACALVGVFTIGSDQYYSDPIEMAEKSVAYLKSEMAIPSLYTANIYLVKMSILFLYRRLFPTPWFRKATHFMMAFVTAWSVTAIIANCLYCRPMEFFWNPLVGGSCFNFALYFFIMGVIELLMDIAIILLPIRLILKLQLRGGQKAALLSIFLLGFFSVATGVIRIPYVYSPGQQLLTSFSLASLWTIVHIGVAILCANLPTLRPLVTKVGSWSGSLWSKYLSSARRTFRQEDDSILLDRSAEPYHKVEHRSEDDITLATPPPGENLDGRIKKQTTISVIRQ